MEHPETRKTALFGVHERLGGKMVPFAGFAMPVQYDGILAEHRRTREHVALFDVSHMGEVWFRGPGALDAVNALITNDLGRVRVGRAQYSAMCAEDGGIVDDLICYRVAEDAILVCVNASNRAKDFAHMQAQLARLGVTGVDVTDEGDAWSQIAVQGPRAMELAGRVFDDKIASLRPFRVRGRSFAGHDVWVSTTGYTGERGVEIYCPNEVAVELWETLERQGKDLGVGPAGLGARDTLRLESAYCLYGNDIDDTTTPLEAGLGWVTRLDKPSFVGRAALLAQKEAGPKRALVGLEVFDRGIPRHDYPVFARGGQEAVGKVTSGTKSPSTGRSIGLAYVPVGLSAAGTELDVDCRGRRKPAVVVETPFYSAG